MVVPISTSRVIPFLATISEVWACFLAKADPTPTKQSTKPSALAALISSKIFVSSPINDDETGLVNC